MKTVNRIVLPALIISALFFGVSKTQDIADWWALRNYTPSPVVSRLSESTSMSAEGEKLFYIHDPQILADKTEFRAGCNSFEASIVLGCYVSNDKIYIYDVKDKRLKGIEEVTAAHEMLHAAFDRLPIDEKERIVALLEAAYEQIDNKRLRDTISSYEEKDPNIVGNELHSILGTEVRDLSSELEAYYARYFVDRSTAVAFSERYEEEFTKRQEEVADYDREIAELKSTISRIQADLSLQASALRNEKEMLEKLRSRPSQFNAAVDSYNQEVASYNQDVSTLKNYIEEHNALVEDRNEIAVEQKDLVDAIDTSISEL